MSTDSNPLEVWLASDQGKRAVAHAEHEREQMKQSDRQGKERDMNVDTGELGELEQVLRNAGKGERVIPATIIPQPLDAAWQNQRRQKGEQEMQASTARIARKAAALYGPRGTYANKNPKATVVTAETQTVATFERQNGARVTLYGPRKPLREVRRELQAAREKGGE
jgi:hypothetical protein